jgi:NhaC family Na+:H+ antiporter
MSVSILCGSFIAVFLQNISPDALLQILLCGYLPENASLAAVLSGGGILSMTKVFLIVCISSCYAGMFDGTGLLKGIRQNLMQISHKITPFGGILLTSILTGAVSCNQTLTIMLTHQLCRDTEPDSVQLASHLENTAVVIAPLIPWSIAGTVPLTSVNAPALCILTAFYLYLIPLWNLFLHLLQTYIPAKCKKQTNLS